MGTLEPEVVRLAPGRRSKSEFRIRQLQPEMVERRRPRMCLCVVPRRRLEQCRVASFRLPISERR